MPPKAAGRTVWAMNYTEKRPRPQDELVALLWVLAALLACLDFVWWLGHHLYS
jgi:hypothetical protein